MTDRYLTKFQIMTMVAISLSLALGLDPISLAAQHSGDPTNGATNYNFHGAGRWWRDIGPETELATSSGPFINSVGHPSQMYFVFWKEPEPGNHSGLSPALDANDFQIRHSLGTTFYYPAGQPAPPGPSTRGYTANDFKIADSLAKTFPNISREFPKGVKVSGCHRGKAEFFFLRGERMTGAFLVGWMPDKGAVNVAVMPDSALRGSFNSVLDNLNYYESGGMVEFMAFGSYFYYLSRLPTSHHLGISAHSVAAKACPPTPIATAKGMRIPKGWTDALKTLKSGRRQ